MKTIFKKTFLILPFLLLYAPAFSFAASILLETESAEFTQNNDVLVKVSLEGGIGINALEGRLTFPTDLLELTDTRDGNSAINFWVEKPHISEGGSLVFSGITAGGITKPKAFLFEVVFHVKKSGSGNIESREIRILQNDGIGTEARVETKPLSFSVMEGSGTANDLKIKDDAPPDTFVPVVANDPNIFEGKHFLVFAAQDKGSGIGHYEVKEGYFGKWKAAESPYLLEDQSLQSVIYVKAVDKNKNEKIAKLNANNKTSRYLELIIVGIILIVGTLILRNKLWRRRKK